MRWQDFKASWGKSQKPFESASAKFGFPISIIACLVATHGINEDWGNFMSWWALGIPGIVWLIYFVWNLTYFLHKTHKDRTPALITILLLAVVSLSIIVFAEFYEMKKQGIGDGSIPTSNVDNVSVLLLPDDGRFNLYNKGKGDLIIYGSKVADEPPEMNSPIIVPEGTLYYTFTSILDDYCRNHIGNNGNALYAYECYLSDSKGVRYVAKFNIYVVIKDGKVTYNTQQMGIEKRNWETNKGVTKKP
jgi:heme/copper-type cytochrome/quinol oxidase subunit 4